MSDRAGVNEVTPAGDQDVARTAARGGLAISFAKAYFMLVGSVQQIALPYVLGATPIERTAAYGALSTALQMASTTYNPVVTGSIQGVSRAVTMAPAVEQPAVLRKAFMIHAAFAVALALAFFLLAPLIAAHWMAAPHIVPAVRFLSIVLLAYGLYTPLVGALNGRRRFLHQAALDIIAATLRTIGLIGGAYWFLQRPTAALGTVEGSALGFVASSTLIFLVAVLVVGVGRRGTTGLTIKAHVAFLVPILVGQIVLNLLLQADSLLLRRFAADAAVAAGLSYDAADPLVGFYRYTQLFSFLPYQLLIAFSFILFPMLAAAVRDADREAIARYVHTGLRLSLLLAGMMVSVTAGLSGSLIRLAFGEVAGQNAGPALEVLALGFGAFAIFSILTTVLNSLKRERQSALVTALAAALVAALCFGGVRGQPFDQNLLVRTALSTSTGIALATVLAAWLVRRAAGALVEWRVLLRVLLALGVAITVGRFLPYMGKVMTLAQAALVALVYVSALVVTREVGKDDLALVNRVFRRRKA